VIVTGLDLSLTATGITVIDGNDITTSRARTDRCDEDTRSVRKRIRTAHHLIVERLPADGLFVVEGPSFNSKYGKPHERAGCGGSSSTPSTPAARSSWWVRRPGRSTRPGTGMRPNRK
jgi:hypothetical protein